MGTKYTREKRTTHSRSELRAHLWDRKRRISPKRRLVFIYLGLGGAAIVLLFGHILIQGNQYEGQPVLEAEALIVQKDRIHEGDGPPHHYLTLAVPGLAGDLIRARALTDEASWQMVRENATIDVSYRISVSGRRAEIVELRARPTPSPSE